MEEVHQLPNPVSLSRQDRQIARLMLLGMSSKLIASALEISVGTVNRHIAEMCERTQVKDRYELVVWLLQNPRCLIPGAETPPGLHPDDCTCSAFCTGRLDLKEA